MERQIERKRDEERRNEIDRDRHRKRDIEREIKRDRERKTEIERHYSTTQYPFSILYLSTKFKKKTVLNVGF